MGSDFLWKTCLEILCKGYYPDNTTTSVAIVAVVELEVVELVVVVVVAAVGEVAGCVSTAIVPS